MENNLTTLESLGFTLPSPWYIFGSILFSIIGYATYRYGKKASLTAPKWIGIALIFYPYAVAETWVLYICGVALCVTAYLYRK